MELAWPRATELTALRENAFVPINGPPPSPMPGDRPARARYENTTTLLSEMEYKTQLDLEVRALSLVSSVVNAMEHDLRGMSNRDQLTAVNGWWTVYNEVTVDHWPTHSGNQLVGFTHTDRMARQDEIPPHPVVISTE